MDHTWMLDEQAFAGDEHLDPGFVAAYDRKQCSNGSSSGFAVRSTVDCLIAAVALRTVTPVVARDPDFAALAEIWDLELLEP